MYSDVESKAPSGARKLYSINLAELQTCKLDKLEFLGADRYRADALVLMNLIVQMALDTISVIKIFWTNVNCR